MAAERRHLVNREGGIVAVEGLADVGSVCRRFREPVRGDQTPEGIPVCI
jgi:hypothetical protein